jgi:poly(3-hydroxybutyrate) depolymerase
LGFSLTKLFARIAPVAVCGVGLAASAGCSSKAKHAGDLAPLTAPSWRVELPVGGFGPASVALPLGATTPRPIVVVLHGARDRAEWQCGTFRGLLGGQVFILCPQGVLQSAQGGLYGLGTFDESAAELRAGLAALKARFGKHVAAGAIVLVGYAEGAAVVADLAPQEPSFFARVALVNGNPLALSSIASKTFAERGGKRALFFCADAACDDSATQRALWLSRGGVATKIARGAVGPYLDAPFVDALRGEMAWLIEGDARFRKPRR